MSFDIVLIIVCLFLLFTAAYFLKRFCYHKPTNQVRSQKKIAEPEANQFKKQEEEDHEDQDHKQKMDTSINKQFFCIDEEPEKKPQEEEKDYSEANLSNVFNLEGEDKEYTPKVKQQQAYKPVRLS